MMRGFVLPESGKKILSLQLLTIAYLNFSQRFDYIHNANKF